MSNDRRLWIYAGLALVAGVGLVSSSSSTAPGKRRLGPGARLLLVGDSLAQGLATPMGRLASEAKVQFLADGKVGTRIDQWGAQQWLHQDISSFNPTIILVSLGTNDMKMSNPLVSQKPYIDKIIELLRSTKADIVWVAPPSMPFPDNGVLELLKSAKVPIYRSDSLVIPRGFDGIHPTVVGYAGWAGAVWRWIDPPIAPQPAPPAIGESPHGAKVRRKAHR